MEASFKIEVCYSGACTSFLSFYLSAFSTANTELRISRAKALAEISMLSTEFLYEGDRVVESKLAKLSTFESMGVYCRFDLFLVDF